MRFTILSLSVFVFPLSALFAQPPYQTIEVKNGASIRGTVRVSGSQPNVKMIQISKQPESCGTSKMNPSLVVGKNRGVKNAVVFLEDVRQGKEMTDTVPVLDQNKCEYEPHVLIVSQGSKVQVINSDSVLHSVHAYQVKGAPDGNPTLFNIALPLKNQKIAKQMDKSGTVLNLCDAGHPWMSSYVLVAEHPYYAVTDQDGNYVLENIPPGSYTLRLWHEGIVQVQDNTPSQTYLSAKAVEQTKKVSLSAGASQKVDFNLSF